MINNKNIKNSVNDINLDLLGRIVIDDLNVLNRINGAILSSDLMSEYLVDAYCNAQCNLSCPKSNPNCHNSNCGC
jgi:hypothetical protein